jgi:hypothetical protein
LREGCRLRVFKSRVLRMVFGPKRDEVKRGGKDHIMRSFEICAAHQILLG